MTENEDLAQIASEVEALRGQLIGITNDVEALRGLVQITSDVVGLRDDIEALQITYDKNTTNVQLNTQALQRSLKSKTKMFVLVLVTVALAASGGIVSNRIVARDIETTSTTESERNCRQINRLRQDIVIYLEAIERDIGQDLGVDIFRPVECPVDGD